MIQMTKQLSQRVPWQAWLALGGVLFAAFWLREHDADVRRRAQLERVEQQASAQVAALKRQAEQDIRRANVENAKTVQKIEERRRAIEQQSQRLAAQLAELRRRAQVQADQVATLPISNVVTRVAAQLGLQAQDVAKGGTAFSHAGADAQPAPGNTAGPKNGQHRTPEILGPAQDDNATALALTGPGARKVAAALANLDACRAESAVEQQQFSTCQARAQADDAAIEHLKDSVASLNDALAAKDKILAQRTVECRAELRAARGTFLGRLARTTEHVAIGVAVGFAIGEAVR
jgi:hypothetical protein